MQRGTRQATGCVRRRIHSAAAAGGLGGAAQHPPEQARRGARVVESGGLENRCAFTGTVGSNPTLSASRTFPARPRGAVKAWAGQGHIRIGIGSSRCQVHDPEPSPEPVPFCPCEPPRPGRTRCRSQPLASRLGPHRVVADSFGDPTAPRVLMLHGIPGWRGTFRGVAQRLAAEAHVVAVDLLGFGESSEPDGDFHAAAQAEMVVALIWQLGGRPVHLVGFDFGGPTAVLAYAKAPELVASLTLAATNLFTDTRIPLPLHLVRPPLVGDLFARVLFGRPGLSMMWLTRRGTAPAVRLRSLSRDAPLRPRHPLDTPGVPGEPARLGRPVRPGRGRPCPASVCHARCSGAIAIRSFRSPSANEALRRFPAPASWSCRAAGTSCRRKTRTGSRRPLPRSSGAPPPVVQSSAAGATVSG